MSISKIQAAVVMTATVLAVIYLLRKAPVAGPLVDRALAG